MLPDGVSPKDWREWRRRRARPGKERGWAGRDLADALGVAEDTVGRGSARARAGGREARRAPPGPGRSPRRAPRQQRLIPDSLGQGPEADGVRGEVRTWARIAKVLAPECGVSDPKGHVARPLTGPHRPPRVPIRRAIPRDGAAIERWRSEVWPALRTRPRRARRLRVFGAGSGFDLLPAVVTTDAPEGRTPELRAKWPRDPGSVMGGMTPSGTISPLARQEPLHGPHPVEFLTPLGGGAGDRLWGIGDGSPIHRRAAVKEVIAAARRTVGVEIRPGSAPDLNPGEEGGGHPRKPGEMRDQGSRDLQELREQPDHAVGRVRQKPHRVRAVFAQAGLNR